MISYRLKNLFFRIANPRFWIQNSPSSKIWDGILNGLLDQVNNGELAIKVEDKHIAIIGRSKIWIENYPYAFGRLVNFSNELPLPLTRVRLKRMVDEVVYYKAIDNE